MIINQKSSYKSYLDVKNDILAKGKHKLAELKIFIFSDHSGVHIVEAVSTAFTLEGFHPIITLYEYGSYSTALFESDNSILNSVDLFIIVPGLEIKILNTLNSVNSSQVHDELLEKWAVVWESLKVLEKPVLQFLYASARLTNNIIYSKHTPKIDSGIDFINAQLISHAPSNVNFLETSEIFNMVGKANSRDALSNYHLSSPFPIRGLRYVVDFIRIYIRNDYNRNYRKLVVLDLDGTLWGGVIGDDGYSGIKVGEDSKLDSAYSDFCHYLKSLSKAGVLLAISSKNDEQFVREYFSKPNPTGFLLDDFVDIKINWTEKYKNISTIAEKLNISDNTFVFVDDNPVECHQVNLFLPNVLVLNVTDDPTQSIYSLDDLRLFDPRTTEADELRNQSYTAIEKITKLSRKFDNKDEFLLDLQMRGAFSVVNDNDLLRLEQMEGKTNQFNTTTRKRTSADIKRDIARGANIFTVRMQDKFANYGLISYLNVGLRDGGCLLVDDWLMSCRVFSRKLEIYILKKLIAFFTQKHNINSVMIKFSKTDKNKVVLGLLSECELKFTTSNDLILINDLSQLDTIRNVIGDVE